MLGSIILTAGAVAVPDQAGAFPLPAALDDTYRMRFTVEEDEMLVRFYASGTLDDAGAAEVALGLALDGTLMGGLPLYLDNLLGTTSGLTFSFEWLAMVSKGEHLLELYGDASAGGNSIDATITPTIITAERVSNLSALAHGVDSKRAGLY